MDNDTFTAGVVPGGLIDRTQIKILICHILNELEIPIFHDDLLEALTSKGFANYFECADALSELVEAKHIQQNDDRSYAILDQGRKNADILAGDVPLTVRERAFKSARDLAQRTRNLISHKVYVTEIENYFKVRCTICDSSGNELFAVELDAPTKSTAQRIRENFVQKAESVMRYCVTELVNEEL